MVARKKKTLWFGYLEAGERSSPVVRDDTIGTGKASTVYLFNWTKGKILEYQRDIVEPKLRDLDDAEIGLVPELEMAFKSARSGFTPRSGGPPMAVRLQRPTPDEPSIDDFVSDDDESWSPLDDERLEPVSAEMAD